ncbi:MAG: hypothetical protein ACM3WU_05860 [Bacillota bacterium]
MSRLRRMSLATCVFLVCLVCVFPAFVSGCRPISRSSAAVSADKANLVKAVRVDPREGRQWLSLSEYEGDLDGDEAPERVELLVRADRSPDDGKIVWDDGQPWLLLVTDGSDYYPLFDQYVQLGVVYFDVREDQAGAAEIQVLLTTGAGFELSKISFSAADRAYKVEQAYASKGVNLKHTSFPSYR